ncbi:DNA-binding response regulator, partial [Klebsiella pneumoniae]
MRLLIIEDELRTADYLQQGLRENGYVVDCAHTGIDGLHLARQQPYD